MLFKPKWYNLLPQQLRPGKRWISELEKLRLAFNIPHDVMMMSILCSDETTKKVQRQCLNNFRVLYPGASEKELFEMVLISRVQAQPGYNFIVTEQEIKQAIENISSFDELCDHILMWEEKNEKKLPDPSGIRKQIDEILAQENV